MNARFDNSYARLPDRFFARQAPVRVAAPRLLALNEELARTLGFDPVELSRPDGVAWLAGNGLPEGADPLAQAYAGHQFGGWVPQLGDGRAILLGEVIGTDGRRYDLQLKANPKINLQQLVMSLHAWLIIIFLSITVPVTTILLARTELFRRRTHDAPSADIPPALSHDLPRPAPSRAEATEPRADR